MKAEIKAERLEKLIAKQAELIKRIYNRHGFLTQDLPLLKEIAALEEEPTAMEMTKEVFEPIQLGENEVVNKALELASKKVKVQLYFRSRK